MSYKTEFIQLSSSIDEINFISKCEFCRSFCHNTVNSVCMFCHRHLSYSKENDIMLFTVKNLLLEISQKKDAYCLSWFDFLQLEQGLLELSEKNTSFFYNPSNLFFYIDFGLNNYETDQVIKTIDNLHEYTRKYFNIPKDKLVVVDKMTSHIISSYDGDIQNRFFYTPLNLNLTRNLVVNNINRENLYEIFCEKLDFVN